MMKFELDNVVKITDSKVKAERLLAKGFKLVEEPEVDQEEQEEDEKEEVVLEDLELPELKELADKREIEYAKNANKEKMLELLGEGE